MLQANEIQQRFNHIEQAIVQANQMCMADQSTSSELKECIQKLDRQTSVAKEALQSRDETRIRKMVEDLEQLGDEAKRVCGTDATARPEMRNAVLRVHDELSDLKHQLH